LKTYVCVLLMAGVGLLPGARLAGQTETAGVHAWDGGIRQTVDGIFIPAVTGAPFTAKVAVEITHALPDGTTVSQKYYTLVARDSQGRVHREKRSLVPADSDREPLLMETYLMDTPERTRTICEFVRRTCSISSDHPASGAFVEPEGVSRDGKSYMFRENLGTSTMDDLDVQETRETRTYNAGTFGNDRPVAVTKEFWYSPQLKINLAVTRNDPRTGEQRLQVTELSLSEPDPSWFVPPQEFKVVDLRAVQASEASQAK